MVASTWQAIRATVAEKAARSSERRGRSRSDEADEARRRPSSGGTSWRGSTTTSVATNYVADMNLARARLGRE